MAVLCAYLSVVLLWATTPLAVQWSSAGVGFAMAVVLRMALALALALCVSAIFRRSLFSHAGAWKVYLAASIGIFPNMPLVYWSAQFIPSGLIALIFAMSPFITGLMSLIILRENPFNLRRMLALLLALGGLVVIFHDQLQIDIQAAYGMLGMVGSSILFSTSSVWLKSLKSDVPAFDQATGSLLLSMPGLLLVCWLSGDGLPVEISIKSAAAIVYLAVGGSLLGFTLFFYVLKKLSPSAVSLITLMTPVLAMMIGVLVADEHITIAMMIGGSLVLLALVVYVDWSFGHWFEKALRRPSIEGSSLELKEQVIRYK